MYSHSHTDSDFDAGSVEFRASNWFGARESFSLLLCICPHQLQHLAPREKERKNNNWTRKKIVQQKRSNEAGEIKEEI